MNIVSITPQLPPKVNGLGDQAWLLALELKSKYDANTVFFNADADRKRVISQTQFKEERIHYNTSKPFLHVLKDYNSSCIVVHYVGYGYSSDGCPDWLVDALKKYRVISPNCKIVTVFYELYASGKPWQRAFWTSSHQKRLMFDLLELSNHSITNTDITYDILRTKAPTKKVHLIPVYSNLGEPKELPLFSQRKNSLVIFGSAAVRSKIFKDTHDLTYWLEKLKIENIIEIGPAREHATDTIGTTPIINKGILSLQEASDILRDSKFCMLHYSLDLLTKSSVFSSYASHGIIPVVIEDITKDTQSSNGLQDGVHYLHEHGFSGDFAAISKNLHTWYQDHNLEKTAWKIYNMLLNK